MKLPCSIVKELLPNYVDGCCGEEALQLVKEHLDTCPACKKLYEQMKEPWLEKKTSDIDYLKKIKRKTHKKIAVTIVLAFILCVVFLYMNLFVFGVESKQIRIQNLEIILEDGHRMISYDVQTEDQNSHVQDYAIEKDKDGIQKVTYKVVKTFGHSDKNYHVTIPLDDVNTYIRIGENLIHKDGILFESRAVDMVDHRIAYVGDHVGVKQLLDIANFEKYAIYQGEYKGRYTIELQTKQEPYQILLHYQDRIRNDTVPAMKADIKAVLASIDNCNEMIITDLDGKVLHVTYDKKVNDYDVMQKLLWNEDRN